MFINSQTLVKALKFALASAPKKDIRFYLNGAFLALDGDGLTVAGTDGSALNVSRSFVYFEEGDDTTPRNIIIGTDACKDIIRLIGKANVRMKLDFTQYNPQAIPAVMPEFSIDCNGVTFKGKGIDGVYPQIERVIPNHDNPGYEMPALCAALMGRAYASLEGVANPYKKSFATRLLIGQTKSDAVKISATKCDPEGMFEAFSVISPMRD